jgi:tRNA(Ile)-lysidine synthase
MALMWLAARWARDTGWPGTLDVAVVDHGLRPEAADEAYFVMGEAEKLGLTAHTLTWECPHPKTGIPAAAREARYDLLFGLARKIKAVVVTAHTQDDQAETVLMRLARGSGVDGLSAMAVHTRRDGKQLFRPLLDLSRERLRATLRQAGVGWIDDPTNENTAHERVRIRKALDVLEGLNVTREALAYSATRIRRARSALEVMTGVLMERAVTVERNSFAKLSVEKWILEPDELQVRTIMELARMFGGGQEISLSGAERVRDWTLTRQGRATTFAGCRFARRNREIIVGREAARVSHDVVEIADGDAVLWDNRYEITLGNDAVPAVIMPVGGVAGLVRPDEVPDFVWRGLPALLTPGGAVTPVDIESGDDKPRAGVEFRFINSPTCVHDDA